jgi:hypothetical protein
MHDLEKPTTKTWVTVTLLVAILGCLGTIAAAIINIVPDILGPKTLPTIVSNTQSSSAPPTFPTLTPFSAQAPAISSLANPTKLSITVTPIPIQGSQVIAIGQASSAEFYSGNITIAVYQASRTFNQVSAYISSPGYPLILIENKRVGYKTIYPANESYEVQIMGISTDGTSGQSVTNISVLKLDNLTKAKIPVVVIAKEQKPIEITSAETFSNGNLVIAVSSVSKTFNQISGEISAPGYEILPFDNKYVGYKVQYQTDKKYEIQITNIIITGNGNSAAIFTVTTLE